MSVILATLPPIATQLLVATFLFCIGTSIGSFINVVVYRLPGGQSLSRPGSRCPACNHSIRWYDNIPVFSWFFLKGRCRDCNAKISARYPVVEAITGLTFVFVAAVEFLHNGTNLPGTYAYHMLLLCTLFSASLIEVDGNKVPARLAIPTSLVGLLTLIFWPQLQSGSPGLDGPIAGLLGAGVGTVLGVVASYASQPRTDHGTIVCLACVGLFLGYQAVICLFIIALCIRLVAVVFPKMQSIPPSAWLTLATFVWIVVWRQPLA